MLVPHAGEAGNLIVKLPRFVTHPLFLTPLLAWVGGFLLMLPIWPFVGSKELLDVVLFRQEIVLPVSIHFSLVCLVCGFVGGIFRLQLLRQKNRLQEQNERLAVQEDQLRDVLTERETLLRILAHDLSNSVSSSHGLIQVLMETEKETFSPVFTEHMDLVLDTLHNGRLLIDSTRKILAVESGKIELTLSTQDLAACVHDTVRQFTIKAKEKDVALVVEVADTAPAAIDAIIFDNCVLGNCISNAIKFSYPGSEVQVLLSGQEGLWRVDVVNHGPCLPKDEVEGLFSISLKSSTPGTAGEAGTGFGLPLAQKFLTLMHGRFEVTSIPVPGEADHCRTCFSILLPKA